MCGMYRNTIAHQLSPAEPELCMVANSAKIFQLTHQCFGELAGPPERGDANLRRDFARRKCKEAAALNPRWKIGFSCEGK